VVRRENDLDGGKQNWLNSAQREGLRWERGRGLQTTKNTAPGEKIPELITSCTTPKPDYWNILTLTRLRLFSDSCKAWDMEKRFDCGFLWRPLDHTSRLSFNKNQGRGKNNRTERPRRKIVYRLRILSIQKLHRGGFREELTYNGGETTVFFLRLPKLREEKGGGHTKNLSSEDAPSSILGKVEPH